MMQRAIARIRFDIAMAVPVAVLALSVLAAAQPVDPSELEIRREEVRRQYEDIAREIAVSQERRDRLASEVASLKKDMSTITAALIQAAKTEKKLAEDIDDIESRLVDLKTQQDGIRESLQGRRAVLTEVLAALQRMGLNPPPAILVAPEDALSSVRSAILLGAVVPELRAETEILVTDLAELHRVTTSILAERDRLKQTVAEQVAERERLDLLVAEKKALRTRTEQEIEAERFRSEQLAERATGLQDLITSLESEIDAVRAAIEARREEEARFARLRETEQVIPESHRLDASVPFDTLKKRLVPPVYGQFVRRFGEMDASGIHATGDTVQTQSGAIVTAPADGNVLFAGRFRSYGQLLILDAGGGYHIVLAGMGNLSVAQGQNVLAGEPVGAMGERRVASAVALGDPSEQPELFIEFRKDKKPVDPAQWWVDRRSGRTGNDS